MAAGEEANPRERYRDIPPLTDDETDVESQDHDLLIRTGSESSYRPSSSFPIWLRESAKSSRFNWVPYRVRNAGRTIVRWIKGPVPPRELHIRPVFASIQEAPIKLLDRYLSKKIPRIALTLLGSGIWLLTWSLMLHHNRGSGYIQGYGKPSNLWCGASFWNAESGCGLNGNECRPFSSAHLAFHCPANCRALEVYEPHVVGNESVKYTSVVIGGNDPDQGDKMPIYRADSFICQAAIHAGVINDETGGCGVVTLVGEHSNYKSTTSYGITSIGFPSTFPRSYTFQGLSSSQAICPKDSRWPLFAVTAMYLVILSLLTTSPAAFFFSTFFIMMLHVGLVSDPPNLSDFHELLSRLCSRLLPATFVAVILYRYCAVPLLTGLTAQVEKTVLYLGFCFIGALNNYTFAPLIPIGRLTPHDLGQPGAKLALGIIISIVLLIIIGQIHFIRVSGNMPHYLRVYCSIGLGLLILLVLPGLRLRIHHYILALVFMYGTGLQTRPGLIYQGLLLGLFINGIARWGFSSIIQTPAELGEQPGSGGGGGTWWGAKPPNVTATVSTNAHNITFHWGPLPSDTGIDGVSILVNDVERWRGYTDEELYWQREQVTLDRRRSKEPEPDFYRFAWLNGNDAGRYSGVGVWDEGGLWHYPQSKI